jgi:hypothetical protein
MHQVGYLSGISAECTDNKTLNVVIKYTLYHETNSVLLQICTTATAVHAVWKIVKKQHKITISNMLLVCLWRDSPQWARAS